MSSIKMNEAFVNRKETERERERELKKKDDILQQIL
jgi:hypothetical protein